MAALLFALLVAAASASRVVDLNKGNFDEVSKEGFS
jgi:hypothetical protein